MGKGVDVGSETCYQHSQVTDMRPKNYSSRNIVLEIWLLQAWGELRRAFQHTPDDSRSTQPRPPQDTM